MNKYLPLGKVPSVNNHENMAPMNKYLPLGKIQLLKTYPCRASVHVRLENKFLKVTSFEISLSIMAEIQRELAMRFYAMAIGKLHM